MIPLLIACVWDVSSCSAGAGGLGTGLDLSGFVETRWAIEFSPSAAQTYQSVFFLICYVQFDCFTCLDAIIQELLFITNVLTSAFNMLLIPKMESLLSPYMQ